MPRSGSTASRGYGAAHRAARAALLGALHEGEACPRCGRPMYLAQALDADHYERARALGGELPDRLAHRRCNRAAGAALGNRLRGMGRARTAGVRAGASRRARAGVRRAGLPTW